MDQNNEPPHITFEGEELQRPARSFNSENPKIIQWVIKYSGGYIKDEKQANYVLIGFVAAAVIVSLFLFFGDIGKTKIIPKFREDIEPTVRAKLPPGVFETIPSKYDR
jgi:predicted PurR-regulated permease PerM